MALKELKSFLEGCPEQEYLGAKGFLGQELYQIKNELQNLSFFEDKNIFIINDPQYYNLVFMSVDNYTQYKLKRNIQLYGLYLTKKNNVFISCTKESLITND